MDEGVEREKGKRRQDISFEFREFPRRVSGHTYVSARTSVPARKAGTAHSVPLSVLGNTTFTGGLRHSTKASTWTGVLLFLTSRRHARLSPRHLPPPETAVVVRRAHIEWRGFSA